MEIVKLAVVFVIIVIALRKKVSVGITLFGAGIITALLYQLDFIILLDSYWELIKSKRFISLTAAILLITMLGSLLKELKYLEKLSKVCSGLYGGKRTAVTILPGLIGLMPMPGGSLLSAPLVNDVLNDKKYPPEFKLVTNYWFRHLVEFFWPIYPGIILTEGITGMPIYKVSMLQFPLTIAMVIIGIAIFIRKIDFSNNKVVNVVISLKGIFTALWPIFLAITLYGIFKLELTLSILLAILLLVVISKPNKTQLISAMKTGLSLNLIFLLFGVLSFQNVLEITGSIDSIPNLAVTYNLPVALIIIMVCFIIGILTGMVSAYVGLGYALLAGILYQPVINPSNILLAYLSGYVGVMLAPTHLCLILTNNYYKSDLSKVYKTMIIPFIILFVTGFLIYLSPWSLLFISNN
ncbi:MAG: DUF401 family protein [Candidatus Zixiibacteriota bacterium]